MIGANIARYQAVKITTSNPGDILVALLDGVFRFLNVAKHSLGKGDRGRAGEAMSRAYAIIAELLVSLDHSHFPELCQTLTGVYDYCLTRITYATRHADVKALEDVMRVMTPVREAFTIAVKSLAQPARQLDRTGTIG
jgi:flagellar protein FliS